MPAAMIQGAPAYYWERDYDRITQALSGLNRMLDEKRKEKERRMARDMAMLQNDPRLAAGPAGKQFMETYADDPQAVAFVDSLARQGERAMNLEAGQSTYFESLFQAQQEQGRRAAEFMGVGRDLQDHADLENEIAGLLGEAPDPQFSPAGMLAQEVGDRASFMQGAEDPRWTAYSGLPAEQRAEVGPWLSQKGQMPMPAILGVGMEGVDPKMAFAAQAGVPAEDLYNMFLRDSGLMPSVNVQAQIDSTAAGRDFTAQQAEEEYKRRLALEAERRKTKQTPPGKAPAEAKTTSVAGAVDAVAKDFAAQRTAAMQEVRALPAQSEERAAALAAVPAPPPTSVKLAATRAFESVKMDPDSAAAKFEEMWMKALAKHGNDQAKASAELLGYFKAKFGK